MRYRLGQADQLRLAGWLTVRAEGNPFFLEELLHALENQQLRQDSGGSWTLDELRSMQVPPMLRQVIDGRLARLGDRAVELLRIGAVIGQQVPLDLWATVSEASSDELATTFEQARAASIVGSAGWFRLAVSTCADSRGALRGDRFHASPQLASASRRGAGGGRPS